MKIILDPRKTANQKMAIIKSLELLRLLTPKINSGYKTLKLQQKRTKLQINLAISGHRRVIYQFLLYEINSEFRIKFEG